MEKLKQIEKRAKAEAKKLIYDNPDLTMATESVFLIFEGIFEGIVQEAIRPKWIKVSDKLPDDYQRVLFFDNRFKDGIDRKEGGIYKGYFVSTQGYPEWFTHWQPLPLTPDEELLMLESHSSFVKK